MCAFGTGACGRHQLRLSSHGERAAFCLSSGVLRGQTPLDTAPTLRHELSSQRMRAARVGCRRAWRGAARDDATSRRGVAGDLAQRASVVYGIYDATSSQHARDALQRDEVA